MYKTNTFFILFFLFSLVSTSLQTHPPPHTRKILHQPFFPSLSPSISPNISLISPTISPISPITVVTGEITTQTQIQSHTRKILHQPFFQSLPPPISPTLSPISPKISPTPQPKYPFSSLPPPTSTTPNTNTNPNTFFPSYTTPPPPPTLTTTPTFPANISSLVLTNPSHSSKPISKKLIAIAISLSLLSALLVAIVATLLLHHHTKKPEISKTDSLRLYPSHTSPSDEPGTSSTTTTTTTTTTVSNVRNFSTMSSSGYHKLGSPELRPLPPLPKQNPSGEQLYYKNKEQEDQDQEEEFFSPTASPNDGVLNSGGLDLGSRSFNSRTASYPSSQSHSPTQTMSTSPSIAFNSSPPSLRKSPDSLVNFPIPPPPTRQRRASLSTESTPVRVSDGSECGEGNLPPMPPPMPVPRGWEVGGGFDNEPPVLVMPSRRAVDDHQGEVGERSEEVLKLKLKPLHWDKVRASSDHAMVWDQLKSSSFQLNEEMIETLFMVNSSKLTPKDTNTQRPLFPLMNQDTQVLDPKKSQNIAILLRALNVTVDEVSICVLELNEEMIETLFMVNSSKLTPKDTNTQRPLFPLMNQDTQVLDPKKSQNIAILLRALNVTVDEVCEALLEGNSDTLGTELLESLLKMAPTKEEERKLKEFKETSPFKLGPAEKFLKAVLDIPFAFQRVNAMLYIANFDSEVEYLKRSFETIEGACEELRNSRMFAKLLEAVLKTGNRMNVGTNRGEARAFKLDTLLKLVDVKGTDGKTTLLHFVVQEIIRAEGSRLSGDQTMSAENHQEPDLRDDIESMKLGLQVVSSLSGELTSVKRSASMDADVFGNEVAKLCTGITKVLEVLNLNEGLASSENSRKLSESMNAFFKKAEEQLIKVQAQQGAALSMVKEITEYFHGNSVQEEARPFRIFMVVRDFLSNLDQVCKEVGRINQRSIVSSARQFPVSTNTSLPSLFPELVELQNYSTSDDESSFSS